MVPAMPLCVHHKKPLDLLLKSKFVFLCLCNLYFIISKQNRAGNAHCWDLILTWCCLSAWQSPFYISRLVCIKHFTFTWQKMSGIHGWMFQIEDQWLKIPYIHVGRTEYIWGCWDQLRTLEPNEYCSHDEMIFLQQEGKINNHFMKSPKVV